MTVEVTLAILLILLQWITTKLDQLQVHLRTEREKSVFTSLREKAQEESTRVRLLSNESKRRVEPKISISTEPIKSPKASAILTDTVTRRSPRFSMVRRFISFSLLTV